MPIAALNQGHSFVWVWQKSVKNTIIIYDVGPSGHTTIWTHLCVIGNKMKQQNMLKWIWAFNITCHKTKIMFTTLYSLYNVIFSFIIYLGGNKAPNGGRQEVDPPPVYECLQFIENVNALTDYYLKKHLYLLYDTNRLIR